MAHPTEVAWVTGSSTGIGRAIALKLAERGHDVVVHYNRSEDKAEEVAGQVRSRGGKALVVRGEVSEAEDVRRMAREIDERFGRVDVLVNNAGSFIERASLDEMTEELWDRTVDVNLKSVYLCSQAVLPLMRQRGGKIVNISSIATWEGGGSIAYAAAKGGVDSLTRAMARELASEGILVNAVSPGRIDTPFHDKFTSPERRKEKEKVIPLRREGTAEEIGAVVAFLASSEASYILGEIIEVNGGQRMG